MKQLLLDVGGAFTWLLLLIVIGVQLYYVFQFHELCGIKSGQAFGWFAGLVVFTFVMIASLGNYFK